MHSDNELILRTTVSLFVISLLSLTGSIYLFYYSYTFRTKCLGLFNAEIQFNSTAHSSGQVFRPIIFTLRNREAHHILGIRRTRKR